MQLYARRRALAMRQAAGDATAVVAAALCVWLGRAVHAVVARLGAPGRELAEAGAGVTRAGEAGAQRAAELPLVGTSMSQPFELLARGGRALADVGAAQQAVAEDLALLLAVMVTVGPLVVLLAVWGLPRLRWIREAAAARRLEAAGASDALLALRALAHRPLAELTRVEADPWAALQRGDTGNLAELERAALGLPPSR